MTVVELLARRVPGPQGLRAGSPPDRGRWPVILLAALVALQILLLGFLAWLFVDPAFYTRSQLEARPLLKAESVVVPRGTVVDNVHVLSGQDGMDPDAERHPLRKHLVADHGHCTWIVLEDGGGEPLREHLVKTASTAEERKRTTADLGDGVLNFFYDLGGREDFFVQNWSAVGARELQLSPLLSWTKRIDFAMLGSFLPDHVTGLSYIARVNPRLPLIAPVSHPDEGGAPDELLSAMARVVRLAPGWHPLTDRLGAFVYETDALDEGLYEGPLEAAGGPPRLARHHAMALLIEGRDGTVLVNGLDGLSPERLIPLAETASGKRMSAYVGATGWRLGSEDPELEKRLEGLRRQRPGLRFSAGYATSPTAQAMLRRILGDAAAPALLGARIPVR